MLRSRVIGEWWLEEDEQRSVIRWRYYRTSARLNKSLHCIASSSTVKASHNCASETNTVPVMFRRSFTTTARLFSRSKGKPPAEEPSTLPSSHPSPPSPPPPPRNDHKPNENANKTEKLKKDKNANFAEHFKATLDPRSKLFIFAFANPKIPSKERSRSLLLATLATFTAWATEPWMMPQGQGQWFPSREEYLVDLVCGASWKNEGC
jgi:hypothetical protein